MVSGAAFGIDASAHRGALAMGRATIAVLACDAGTDYPRAHAALLSRIAESGLIVSEQPPGQVPTKARFLSRNRLIAGLAGGTVVVEARRRSGSLNTLHWADRLGRPTMAVPGPVTSQQSGGTHQAVRDGKAVLVTGGSDVLSELAGIGAAEPEPVTAPATEFDHLPAPAQRALDALTWQARRPPATSPPQPISVRTTSRRRWPCSRAAGWPSAPATGGCWCGAPTWRESTSVAQ